MKKILGLCFLLASFGIEAASNVVFLCDVKGGKQVKITKIGDYYQYSFGKPNNPELVFRNSKAQVIKQSPRWDGMGSHMWAGMLFKNGAYEYHVTDSIDRMNEEHAVHSGVTVSKGDTYLTYVQCVNEAQAKWDDEFMI
ncbi:hypothetical protein [Acinetobacter larvae]|uniref:Uncharacterized protein n=1 Tax=Acinetobacter larvae TaxID=1789224 RepID=A0A1B2LZF4_9GAMM|nr:hypothetical protein [Acinetobacter larvae]AOA58330.1 hypothetical protein BFG52_08165 [Acinetobacter larvae]